MVTISDSVSYDDESASECRVLTAYTTYEIESQMNLFLRDRWRLHGPIVCHGDGQYLQVVVR